MSTPETPDTPPPTEPDAMLVRTVAAKLGVGRQHVYRLIKDGYLDVIAGPGAMKVTTASYRRYLASATTGHAAAPAAS